MKQLIILLVSIFAVKTLPAQQSDTAQINKSLELVIRNLPAGLSDVKGALISKRGQTSRFHSKVTIAGAAESLITEQVSFGRKEVSWKCILLRSVQGAEVIKRYSEVYNQLNNTIIRSATDKPFILSGKYKQPSGNQTTISRFQLLPSTPEMKDVRVDLVLEEQNNEFILSITLHH